MTAEFEYVLLLTGSGQYQRRYKGQAPSAGDHVTLVIDRKTFHLPVNYTHYTHGEAGIQGVPRVHLKLEGRHERDWEPEQLDEIKAALATDDAWTRNFN